MATQGMVSDYLGSVNLNYIKESVLQIIRFIANNVKKLPTCELSRQKQSSIGVLLILIGGQLYYWQKFTYWSRLNVKGPRPVPIFGNLLTFLFKPRQKIELDWVKKYGKIYGFYMGTRPFLACADAELIQRICVKDFHLFRNHYLVGTPNKYQRHFLIFQKDDHWRGIRAIMSPTFSGARIKSMVRIMDNCAEELAEKHRDLLESSPDGQAVVDCRKVYASFTMGSGLSCFYGVEPKRRNDDHNIDESQTKEGFAKRSGEVTRIKMGRFLMVNLLPDPILKLTKLPLFPNSNFDFFAKSAHRIMDQRLRTGNRNHVDYLQLLLDARRQDHEQPSNEAQDLGRLASDKHEDHHAPDIEAQQADGLRPSRMQLTEEEVSCQMMMFMVVATETTAALMSNCLYLLAVNPEIQERLYQELLPLAKKSDSNSPGYKFDYEQLTSCLYLDCVMSETMRLLGTVLVIDRVASEDYYVDKYDLTIPKGTVINLALYAVGKDPEYWTNPELFDPERFMPENKKNIVPGSYVPFGMGPRACVGFRFALAEAKVALSKLICEFKFHKAPDCDYPPKYKGITFLVANNLNLFVTVTRR